MAFLTIATTSLAFTEIFTCSRMGTCSKVTDKKMNEYFATERVNLRINFSLMIITKTN